VANVVDLHKTTFKWWI